MQKRTTVTHGPSIKHLLKNETRETYILHPYEGYKQINCLKWERLDMSNPVNQWKASI